MQTWNSIGYKNAPSAWNTHDKQLFTATLVSVLGTAVRTVSTTRRIQHCKLCNDNADLQW